MPSPDEIGVAARDAATAYGVEEFVAGAASRQGEVDGLAAQERADVVTIAGLRAANAVLQDELATLNNEPPSGFTVPNSAAEIQVKADGGDTFLTNGDWLLPAQLKASDGFNLRLAPNARLIRTWNSSTAASAATIANRTWRSLEGFSLRGGHLSALPGKGGGVLAIWADDMILRDFTSDYFIGGRFFVGGGERPTIDNIEWHSAPYDYTLGPDQPAGSGTGGLRWMTGGGGKITNCRGDSGDDALQFVPAGSPSDPLWNAPDIHDISYEDCTVRSYKARVCVIGLQDSSNVDGSSKLGMRSGVRNVAFRRIRGTTSGTPVNIANHSSLGGITDVEFEDVEIVQDGLLGSLGQPAEVWVSTFAGLGAVDRINLAPVRIISHRDPPKRLFATKGPVGSVIPPAA